MQLMSLRADFALRETSRWRQLTKGVTRLQLGYEFVLGCEYRVDCGVVDFEYAQTVRWRANIAKTFSNRLSWALGRLRPRLERARLGSS